MKPIGGYFELELARGNRHYHDTPLTLKSGRASLHYLLNIMRPSLVYVPFYTCDALLEPFAVAGIKYRFYSVNQHLEIADTVHLKTGEYLVYVNYFDLKRDYTSELADKYGDRLVIDATQAFFLKGDGRSWLFNSCRKFFGVPDGSYLYTPGNINILPAAGRNEKYTTDHLLKRFNGHVREGYPSFVANEEMCDSTVTGMSVLSEHILSLADYEAVAERRRSNYNFLFDFFREFNLFQTPPAGESAPMCYPLFTGGDFDKSALLAKDIFIPTFWEEVMKRKDHGFDFEKEFANGLLPLPVDHRLGADDMERLANEVMEMIR